MATPGTNDCSAAVWRLRIQEQHRDGLLVITTGGRIGAADAPRLAGVLADAITAGERRILLDLKGLDYISSAGVIALEAAAARLRTEQGELILSGVTPPVRLALDLAGFPSDVRIVAAEDYS